MLLEIRYYWCQPGQRDAWVAFFEDTVVPFQTARGMQILGSFVDEENDDGFVWLRRFDSEEQRLIQYDAVHQDPDWKRDVLPKLPALLDSTRGSVITRLIATPGSAIQ